MKTGNYGVVITYIIGLFSAGVFAYQAALKGFDAAFFSPYQLAIFISALCIPTSLQINKDISATLNSQKNKISAHALIWIPTLLGLICFYFAVSDYLPLSKDRIYFFAAGIAFSGLMWAAYFYLRFKIKPPAVP
ncbi:hypothetical protein PQU92_11775 [Asticcacaulis sp. BYS171W]|uniref:Uncharacterized protein n=1 Tax=Asticcacaulis aquaticus TaxID=2984212 RepID=A0ABT5HV73_9CAUL|nr:hypothetical protein [Asticcacaulis aquaticus]MDC7683958.1 hypothetical protein [Asticcacaulis aquaticus]